MKRRVVLLGPPGSGKGTVAERLQERFKLTHLSTGQWFRREIESGTPLGLKAGEFMREGALVPDEIVLGLLDRWLTPELWESGFLLDGFPRTVAQAEALDAFCQRKGWDFDAVLYLDCPEAVILERITGRRVCSECGKIYHIRSMPPTLPGRCDVCGGLLEQRADDSEPVVRKRLAFYAQVTAPLVDYYLKRGKLAGLNAALGSDAATAEAVRALES